MTINIDGKPYECEHGEYLLDIFNRNGIIVPTLCHHEGLPEQGCCRVCIVEVEINDWRSIVTACVYPIERECLVYTQSEKVKKQRGMILSLLRSLAPESGEVAALCEKYDAPEHKRFQKKADKKCILCGLCTKACQSLGTGAISTAHRGIDKVVTTPYDEPSLVCVGCASCAMVCPVGAIKVEENDKERRIWNKELPLMACKNCGTIMGTFGEVWRSTKTANTELPDLCEACKKKTIAKTMAATYGR